MQNEHELFNWKSNKWNMDVEKWMNNRPAIQFLCIICTTYTNNDPQCMEKSKQIFMYKKDNLKLENSFKYSKTFETS
jgi:hypothetical protein